MRSRFILFACLVAALARLPGAEPVYPWRHIQAPASVSALGLLTPAANRFVVYSAADSAAMQTITPFALTLLDDTNAATMRATLGLGTGDSPSFAGLTLANGAIRVTDAPDPNASNGGYLWSQAGVGPTISGLNVQIRTGLTGAHATRLTVSDATTTVTNNLTVSGAAGVVAPAVMVNNGAGTKALAFYNASSGGGAKLQVQDDVNTIDAITILKSGSAANVAIPNGTLAVDGTGTNRFGGNITLSATGKRMAWDVASLFYSWIEADGTAGAGNNYVRIGVGNAEVARFVAGGNVILASNLTIAGTSQIKGILTATKSIDWPSIAAGAAADDTVTVTGAVVGDSVAACAANGAAPPDAFDLRAYVSAPNTVTVRAINRSVGALDPAAQTYRVTLIKF